MFLVLFLLERNYTTKYFHSSIHWIITASKLTSARFFSFILAFDGAFRTYDQFYKKKKKCIKWENKHIETHLFRQIGKMIMNFSFSVLSNGNLIYLLANRWNESPGKYNRTCLKACRFLPKRFASIKNRSILSSDTSLAFCGDRGGVLILYFLFK